MISDGERAAVQFTLREFASHLGRELLSEQVAIMRTNARQDHQRRWLLRLERIPRAVLERQQQMILHRRSNRIDQPLRSPERKSAP